MRAATARQPAARCWTCSAPGAPDLLSETLCNRPSQHDTEPLVELRPRSFWQIIALSSPGKCVGKPPGDHGERECVRKAASPRLQICVAQPREPRVARRQLVELLEEAEGDDERRKRVRDRRIAPVEHPQPLALSKAICHVQVASLNC